jgi:molybdenum cofactor cytidylyltransferase
MSEAPIAAVVLAAGESRRWGEDNKLVASIGGSPMIRRTTEIAIAAEIGPVIVVTGHQPQKIRSALKGLKVTFARAADFAEGMSASLKTGIGAVPADCAGALICLGDMPYLLPDTARLLAMAYKPQGPWVALVPTWEGERGNPVLIGRPLFPQILRLSGDRGAKGVLAGISERVLEVPVADSGILRDVDRPDAIAG